MSAENKPKTGWKKGQSGNPGGRPSKTPDQRAGEDFLTERTLEAAERLVRCAAQAEADGDWKTAGALSQAHLKVTLGEHIRQEVRDVSERSPLVQASVEELVEMLAMVRAKKGTT